MVFVTGATGLLGSHLILELLKKGENVRAMKRENSKVESLKQIFSWYVNNAGELYEKIEWVDCELEDYEMLVSALKDVEYVYHCAAMVSFNPKDKAKMISNNVNGTANIVNACLENNIKKLCHVSSVSALGNASHNSIIDESTPRIAGSSFSGYSTSKYKSELEVWRGISEGLNAVILNPSIIIGTGLRDNGSQRLFAEIYKGLKYYTTGITGYVDVRDVVKIMIELTSKEITNERYCINSENLSYKEVFENIAESLNLKAPSKQINSKILSLAWRIEKIRSAILGTEALITKDSANSAKSISHYSNKKIVNELNIEFIPIHESIKHTAKIFMENK